MCCFLSCKKEEPALVKKNNSSKKIDSQYISKKSIEKLNYPNFVLDNDAAPIIATWQKYTEIEELIHQINLADLTYFKNNSKNIQELMQELTKTIPNALKTPLLEARIKVLETKLLKLESTASLDSTTKEDLLPVIKEVLVANSFLILQINKKIEKDAQEIEKP